jgi:hypothetical protein
MAEVTELREKLARAEAEAKAAYDLGAAKAVTDSKQELFDASVAASKAQERAAALRELADRLTTELAEARRPWWRRWRG